MNHHAKFEAALKGLIELAGSQERLAKSIGCTQPSISQWLRGQTKMGPIYALAAERIYGVSRHDLRPDIYPRETTVDRAEASRFMGIDGRAFAQGGVAR